MHIFIWKAYKIKGYLGICCLSLVLAVCFFSTYQKETAAITAMLPTGKKVIVIDAGHGGWDPGRTGVMGENEKDINLKIAAKLQQYLEQGGATVLITRNEDSALSNDKREDLKGRKDIINTEKADIFISIHQNSYPQEKVKGGQVFYLEGSEEGETLAKAVQGQIITVLDPNNHRVAKPNATYYLLKNTKATGIIVECGFLTNQEEEAKLNTEEYQDRVAWAIYLGIMDYFSEKGEGAETGRWKTDAADAMAPF